MGGFRSALGVLAGFLTAIAVATLVRAMHPGGRELSRGAEILLVLVVCEITQKIQALINGNGPGQTPGGLPNTSADALCP